MSAEVPVRLTVNGNEIAVEVPTSEMLFDTARDRLGLTGANLGCDHASCGACTMIVDGDPRASCSTFTWAAEGAEVTTIEGLGGDSPVQRAFADRSAFQCGYCTPGLIMTTTAMLAEIPEPDETTIREWISSNICRCTGYAMIIEAAQAAAEESCA
ncbi:MAG: (2Fe-2S)-binding protein [Actinomycetota bacterium]